MSPSPEDRPEPPAQRPRLTGLAPAVATGLGPMPGLDVTAAARAVRDELTRDGGVPFLAELPRRGPGADPVGRALGLLGTVWSAWSVETTPTGWRLCDAPGRDSRRAHGFRHEDLDVLEEVYEDWSGPLLLPLTGPWTIAASVELPGGARLLRDPGVRRDLLECWGEAAGAYAGEVRRRVPGSDPVVAMDEPALPAVLAGTVGLVGTSGYRAVGTTGYRAVQAGDVRAGLADQVARLERQGVPVLVGCGVGPAPLTLLREAGAAGVWVGLAGMGAEQQEQVGEAVEAGQRVGLGLPGRGLPVSEVATTVTQVMDLAHRLGFGAQTLADALVLTSDGGLAECSMPAAATELARVRSVGQALRAEGER